MEIYIFTTDSISQWIYFEGFKAGAFGNVYLPVSFSPFNLTTVPFYVDKHNKGLHPAP